MIFQEEELHKIREVQKELNYGNLLAKKVISYVCMLANVDVQYVMGKSIKREEASARHICWHILHKKYSYSYSDIEKIFNVKERAIRCGIEDIDSDIRVLREIRYIHDVAINMLENK